MMGIRNFSRFAALGAVSALALTTLQACAKAEAQSPLEAPAVTVANPIVRSEAEFSEHPGRFVAAETVDVRPRVSGYLQAVHFHDGDYVRQGQLLFVIDPLPFKAQAEKASAEVSQAQARLAKARSDLARAEALKAAEAISQEEYDSRKEALAQAVAGVQAAKAGLQAEALDLSYTRVYAPISGRISDRRVDAGNLVTGGDTLLTRIVSVDPIHFEFSAPDALLATRTGAARNGGAAALVQIQGEPGFTHQGRLDFLDNSIDPATGSVRGRVVMGNGSGAFTPGQFGRVRLLGDTRPVVLAPDTAISTDQSRKYVLVVGAKNLVQYRQVEIGQKIGDLRVIRAGLSAADRVIVNGLQRAQPGQPVTPTLGRIVAGPKSAAEAAQG
jgi:RND family efflux transporter MFP subunit